MRSTILVAAVLAFASLALGGCTADAQEPASGDSNIASGQGASPVAETKLRDGVEKAPMVPGFDNKVRDIATKEGNERFEGKRIDGVDAPAAKAAEGKRDVIIGVGAGSSAADTRRDVTGNGGYADGLADGRIDGVEQPANAGLFETALDESVQVNANKDDIAFKARAAR